MMPKPISFILSLSLLLLSLTSSLPISMASSYYHSHSHSHSIKAAYWPSWLLQKLPTSKISTSYFTHLYYAFLVPHKTTFKLNITTSDHSLLLNFTAAIHSKRPPATTVISVGGGGAEASIFSRMAASQKTRSAFINSTIGIARRYGFDGLDLDWEFPKTVTDMSNLGLLFKEWREAVEIESATCRKPRLILSAAVYFASSFFLAKVPLSYPYDAISKYLDHVSPMCYDYHGSWDTSVTGAQALLYDRTSNISTSYGLTSWIRAGVPAKKLVMGLPLYGRTWKLKDPYQNGIGAPAVGLGPGQDGEMGYSDIVAFNHATGATVVYDGETVSTYSYAGNNWIGYDGPQSIAKKVKFAKAYGLGGYFFWAAGYDKDWIISKSALKAWNARQ